MDESINFRVSFKKLWSDIISVGVEILIFLAICIYAFFITSSPAPVALIPFAILIFLLFVIELLWLLYGVEILEVSNADIVMKHQMFRFALSKKFRSNKVKGVFVSRNKMDDQLIFQLSQGFRPADFKKGMVAIHYGKTLFGRVKIYRFGTNLNEVEAQQIVKLILEKFPHYIYSSTKKMG